MKQKSHTEKGILITGPNDFIEYHIFAINIVDNQGSPFSDLVLDRRYIRRIKHGRDVGIYLLTGVYISWNYNQEFWTPRFEAGCLVHEAKHMADFRERPIRTLLLTRKPEQAAYELQNSFYEKIGHPRINIESMLARKSHLETILPYHLFGLASHIDFSED